MDGVNHIGTDEIYFIVITNKFRTHVSVYLVLIFHSHEAGGRLN